MTGFGDQRFALVCVAKLAAFAVVISALEYLARPKPLQDGGLLSWSVASLRSPWLVRAPVGQVLGSFLAYPNVLWLIGVRGLLAGVVLIATPSVTLSPLLIVPLAMATVLFQLRGNYGLDGADQMVWLIVAGLTLVSVVDSTGARAAFLWFIAAQCCLAYFVAGVAKASASSWRDGTYLVNIFKTRIYGHRTFAEYLQSHPMMRKLAARGIIFWECIFPLVLIVPAPVSVLMITAGLMFHVGNAFLMGLNTFLWSFAATYPAILYCVQVRGW